MAVYKRIWQLQLQVGEVVKTFKEQQYSDKSLKIDFDINNGVYGRFANGTITIYNLNIDDMQFLASSYSPVKGQFKKNKVSLEVGYFSDGLSCIIKGNIIEVDCDFTSIDNKITLRVQGAIGNNLLNNNKSTSYKGQIDFKILCDKCAKDNNLTLKYNKDIKTRLLNNFSFNGTPYQFIEKLRSLFNDINIFLDEQGEILNVTLSDKSNQINKQELSNQTGLIGKPQPTMLGCNVRSVLNVNFKAGGLIKLKNETLKELDGVYKIMELKHRGTNLGENWESLLTLRKIG